MTKDGVMTMTDKELRIRAAELLGAKTTMPLPAALTWKQGTVIGQWEDEERGKIWREIPDYPSDIKAAWKLFEQARNGDRFWDFCTALKDLAIGDDSVPAWKNYMVILGHLSPGIITRAFILAMEEGE